MSDAVSKPEAIIVPAQSARLTIRRMPNGQLIPHVDGVIIEGALHVQCSSDVQSASCVIAFDPRFVLFDTALDPDRNKLS